MRRYVGRKQFSIGSQPRRLSLCLHPTALELQALVKEQAARPKTHVKEEAEKGGTQGLGQRPAARLTRLADSAVAPTWNVQVATGNGFIICIYPTDQRKDGGLAPGLSRQFPSAVSGFRNDYSPTPR